jgi:hypothetical protein
VLIRRVLILSSFLCPGLFGRNRDVGVVWSILRVRRDLILRVRRDLILEELCSAYLLNRFLKFYIELIFLDHFYNINLLNL